MDPEVRKRRWIEIQFYFILKDLIEFCRGFPQALNWIETIRINDAYNPDVIKQTATVLIQVPWAAPSRGEVIGVSSHFKYPVRAVKRWLGIYNQQYYALVERTREDQYIYIPKFNAEQDKEIERFVDFIKALRGIGT